MSDEKRKRMPGANSVRWRNGVPESLRGTTFLYPCSGPDWVVPIQAFGGLFEEFRFVDVEYRFRDPDPLQVDGWRERGTPILQGPAESEVRWRDWSEDGVESCRYREMLVETGTGREITVERCRNHGQDVLEQVPDGSLGMFLHRNDSLGEGGSNTFFFDEESRGQEFPGEFSNRAERYGRPSRDLFPLLKRKLAYPALLASDGSNCTTPQILRATERGFSEWSEPFTAMGLVWREVGALPRYGLRNCEALVWQVTLA